MLIQQILASRAFSSDYQEKTKEHEKRCKFILIFEWTCTFLVNPLYYKYINV